jgi:glycosyltransferase involved in cell wall biosynthesis
MHVWLVKLEEPLPVDAGYRPYRMGMLADALVTAGHTITRWASDYDHLHHVYRTGKTGCLELADGQRLCLLHKKTAYKKSVSVKRILNNVQLAHMFEKEGRRMSRPDLIVCAMPTPEMAAASARLARKFNIPLVLDARDMWPDIIDQALKTRVHKLLAFPVLSAMRKSLRYAARHASSLVGITPFYRDHLLRYAGRKAGELDAVFFIGFDSQAVKNDEEEYKNCSAFWDRLGIRKNTDEFYIYFAGRLNKTVYNALGPVVEAGTTLLKELPDVRIVLCGSGDYTDNIQQKTEKLPNIILAGEVSSGCLKVLQERAHVSLLCIERRIDYQMSLSNKFFEYLQAGFPVLSGLDGLPGELLIKHGCGFVYNDGRELGEQIRMLRNRPDLRAELGSRAKQLFEEQFSASQIYAEFVAHLEKVVDRTSMNNAKTYY